MSKTINPTEYEVDEITITAFSGAEVTTHKDGTVSIRMTPSDLLSMANSATRGEAEFAKSFRYRDPGMVPFNEACMQAWQQIVDAAEEIRDGKRAA